MLLPEQPSPIDWLRLEWAQLHTGYPLTDFTHTTAYDGRPVHEARVPAHLPGAALVTKFAATPMPQGFEGAQQRPILDLSDPARVSVAWLLNGEWLIVWAPRTPVPAPTATAPVPRPEKPVQRASWPKSARPSGRLPFGRRRTNNRKETRT